MIKVKKILMLRNKAISQAYNDPNFENKFIIDIIRRIKLHTQRVIAHV